jgi:pyruvate dehydrogenase E2 component (dihydrolipoamide acetyltransferase)
MASAIKLPDMGTNVEECKVLSWRVGEGDTVRRGDILADIETDKAVAELESTAEGVLLKHVVKAGGLAHTGDILAYVGKPGDSIPDAVRPAASPGVAAAEPRPPVTPAAPETLPAAALSHGPAAPVASPSNVEPGPSVRVSPMVRNLAAKLGVDLSRVQGTGPGGLITREDVQRASQALSS